MFRFPNRMVLAVALTTLAGAFFTLSASAQDKELVQYRLVAERSIHMDDAAIASQYQKSLTQLGCQAKVENHGDHIDLVYHCPSWRQVEFNDHAAAHKWENWLRALRFEVKHAH